MSTEWEFRVLVSMQALDRGVSDQTQLLLETGAPSYTGITKQFKMEFSWFAREDFYKRVQEVWNKPVRGQNSIQRWNTKLEGLSKHLRGWPAHSHSIYRQ